MCFARGTLPAVVGRNYGDTSHTSCAGLVEKGGGGEFFLSSNVRSSADGQLGPANTNPNHMVQSK